MLYADVTELPDAVREAYSDTCQATFLEAFNTAAEGGEDEEACFRIAHEAARECMAADDETETDEADEAGAEPDCGCDHRAAGHHGIGERKVLPLKEAAVSDTGELTGYANVFGIVDDGGDRVRKGAFKGVIPQFLKEGFVSWAHDWATPVALPLEAVEDDHGVKIRARFHSTPRAQEARAITQERLAAGLSMGLSIGYEVGDAKRVDGIREINSFKRWFETGLVLVPMNRPSLVTAAKGSLGSGQPYATRLALALARAESIDRELKWLASHSRERADLRQKEGRVLSAANRERLTTLKTSLSAVLRDIEDLLRATDPDRDKAAAQAAIARSFLTLAGVTD